MNKRRVVLYSHTYLDPHYRGKLECLGRSVDLTLISPTVMYSPYGDKRARFDDIQTYKVLTFPPSFPAPVHTSTRFVLKTRDLGFKSVAPDLIQIENELHSFAVMQALVYRRRYAPRARVVLFGWGNLLPRGVSGFMFRGAARLFASQIDHYIAGNQAGRALLLTQGIASDRITVFPQSGVALTDLTTRAQTRITLRAQLKLAPEEFIVGYVGRLVVEKGVHDLLSAIQQLRAQGLHVRLLCVGQGLLETELRTLEPSVLVTSPGAAEQVQPYYTVMDALALPSRTTPTWSEQFGRVLVEAMSFGVPVIGSDSGAIPEVIGDPSLIYPEGDVRALTAKLFELAESADLRRELGLKARQRVAENFTHAHIAQQTLQVYDAVGNLP